MKIKLNITDLNIIGGQGWGQTDTIQPITKCKRLSNARNGREAGTEADRKTGESRGDPCGGMEGGQEGDLHRESLRQRRSEKTHQTGTGGPQSKAAG